MESALAYPFGMGKTENSRTRVEEIGRRVRAAMQSAGMKQEALAARTGISQPVISKIVRGELARPNADYLMQIAKSLGVSYESLLPGGTTPHPETRAEPPPEGSGAISARPLSMSDAQRRLREQATRYVETHVDDLTPRERRFLENLAAFPETERAFSDAEYDAFFAGLVAGLRAPKAP